MSAIALAIISIGDNEDVLLRVLFKDSVKGRGWQRSQTSHVINGDEKM